MQTEYITHLAGVKHVGIATNAIKNVKISYVMTDAQHTAWLLFEHCGVVAWRNIIWLQQ